MDMFDINEDEGSLPMRAAYFSLAAHTAIGQLRKYTGEPYFVHPYRVAQLARSFSLGETGIAIAYLHDVLEDVDNIKEEIIFKLFGDDVGKSVVSLTNVGREAGNRKKRFFIDAERLGESCFITQSVKLCDLIDNTSSIVDLDPKFAFVYLTEKRLLISDFLTKIDDHLREFVISETDKSLSKIINMGK